MAVGVPEETRDYVRVIFAELLATRSQRDLARELEINQSRVSTALNTGRLAPDTLWKAAKLAGRSEEEVKQHLRRTVALKRERAEPRQNGYNTKNVPLMTPKGVEEAVKTMSRLVPRANPTDVYIACRAVSDWGYVSHDPETFRLAYDMVTRMHATLDLAWEVKRLRWALDKLREQDPTPAADSRDDSSDEAEDDPESAIDSPERG
jgi:plasmid maintenance system antidote protein VapI